MLVKLIDGTPHIANVPDEAARASGYKEAVFSEQPNTEAGYHAESYWTEESDACVQHWNVVFDPDPDIDEAEAFQYLFGGDSE